MKRDKRAVFIVDRNPDGWYIEQYEPDGDRWETIILTKRREVERLIQALKDTLTQKK